MTNRSLVSVCVLVLSSAAACPAHASVAVGAELGSAGAGAQATVELIPWLNLRGTIQGLDYSQNFSKDNTPYNSQLNLLSYGVLLDAYPLTRGPRVSAGFLGNGNKLDLNANCNQSQGCTANNDVIKGANARFFGDMKFDSVAPYVGLGWGNAMVGTPFYVSGDLGVMFQGTAKVSLNGSGTASVTNGGVTRQNVNIATDPEVQQQLQQEQTRLANQVSGYKYYPVAALTIGWRF